MLLKFFIDESYNIRMFNYGGWLAEEQEWTRIGNQWSRRIEYERGIHGKLQCADMIAFDTFKLLDKTLHATSAKMRRSLQNLVGKGVRVEARYFSERVMQILLRIHERRQRTGETVQQALAADDAEFGSLQE